MNLAKETLLLVASPDMANRLRLYSDFSEALPVMPFVAYDDDLPLIREYVHQVFDMTVTTKPVVTAPDLETVAQICVAGGGWTVLPDYLSADLIGRNDLERVDPESPEVSNKLYLVWPKTAVRDTRTMFVRGPFAVAAAAEEPVGGGVAPVGVRRSSSGDAGGEVSHRSCSPTSRPAL